MPAGERLGAREAAILLADTLETMASGYRSLPTKRLTELYAPVKP